VPALLKPAPAELITLLWALKNDGLDKPGYGDLIPVLAAGRTSVVTDPGYERTFYKLAGFRFLGKRAVRIDILERLADLIRPLLQWKPGQASRPDGAYDGRRFTTTTAMLSILGATLEDMEEILKGLGYRADAVKAEEATAFLAQQDAAAAPAAPAGDATAEKADHDDADTATDEPAKEVEAVSPETAAPAEAPAETEVAVAAEPVAAAEVAAEPAEPKPVLLWRLGGRNDHQQRQGGRGHGDRRGQQGEGRGQQGNRRGGEQAAGEGNREGGRDRRDGRDNREARGSDKGPRGNREGGRPQHQGNRGERGDRQERGDRNDRNNRGASQPLRFEAKPPRKEKPIDPDSPFAKLAALKEQMKK
jgi:ATP-dependent RNA helicase SUPV3L1/SUV3